VVVQADAAPEKVMTQLKLYASRALNRSARSSARRWAHHGSTRYLWDNEQVDAAVDYVIHRQGRPMALYINPDRRTQPNPER
jgi:hypothetical protein